MEECDPKVYKHGRCIIMTHSVGSKIIEDMCIAASKEAGFKIDWHYVGGRAIIKTLGDAMTAHRALWVNRKAHDEKFMEGGYYHPDALNDIWGRYATQ